MSRTSPTDLRGAGAARAALAAGRNAMIWREIVADTLTPVAAALALFEEGRGDFLLESVEGGEVRGRYSLLGIDPDLVFRAREGRAEVNGRWRVDREAFDPCDESALPALRALERSCRFALPEGVPPVLACLVGYLGYETIGQLETVARAPESPLDLPDLIFVRPTVLLIFDQLSDTLLCAAPLWARGGDQSATVEAAAERIDEVLRTLLVQNTAAAPRVEAEPAQVEARVPDAGYRAMVLRAKEYIAAGDIFQVVLAQRFSMDFPLPPMALYRSLRRINPSPFLYLLDLPGFAVVGSSPEILVRVRGDEVTIRPIAGTRPRGRSPAEDAANAAALLADPKERAEHLMLLDLGRNDVGRSAHEGSVAVTDSFAVERYSHVMHIVSNVTGKLADGRDALDALMGGFPAGTVSGAPKIRACQIIAELEPETRGAYAGGVGYFSPDGSVDSCIVLRTAVVKDGAMHVQAGAGIVADSDPDYEQRECEAKADALFAAAHDAIARAQEADFGQ